MRLHKLVIFAMLLALLSILAVPTYALAHQYDSQQYTLEPLDGHNASMRDMAGPGLQLLTSKNKCSTNFIADNDSASIQSRSIELQQPRALKQQAKGSNQDRVRPLWLINRAMLI
ncbi:MAG: hypothetical protein WC028_19950 [Candidatus Obscuribacterales bacterium]|jgi:hypothetical protein